MTDDIRGILFDKDGTLIDFNKTWLPRYFAAAKYLAARSKQSSPDKTAEQLMASGGYQAASQTWDPDCLLASGSNAQILDHWERYLDIELGEAVRRECLRLFAANEHPYAAVLDDMDGFFSALHGKSIQLGVATMDDESTAIATLKSMELSHYFDFVCGADSGYGLKPQPGMVLAFCERCGLQPSQVMMVGDSPRDLLMGRNAGVGMCIGVLTGAHERESLQPSADYVFDTISGLLDLV